MARYWEAAVTIRDDSGLYVRKATGLVRAAGRWSVLIYNIMFVSIGLMVVFAISLIPAFYPGSNIQLSFLLALVIVLPTSMVFAMLSVAMPRSGGDYVYVSRALGPAWGMMSNWNQTVWWVLYGGVPSAFFAYYGLTPLLRSLVVLTNNPGLITRSEEHTSELQSRQYLVCRLLLEKKKKNTNN